MTYRAAETIPSPHCRELIESCKLGYVEMTYRPKWINRPTAEIIIHRGNHAVAGIEGPHTQCDSIVCLHAPLRSRAILENKAEQGRRLDEAGIPEHPGWHVRRWARLEKEGQLDEEWAANSYQDGHLEVYGERHKVIFDPRLRDAVAPLVRFTPTYEDVPRRDDNGHIKNPMRSVAEARREIRRLTKKNQRLSAKTRRLQRELSAIRNSKSWRLFQVFDRLKAKFFGGPRSV